MTILNIRSLEATDLVFVMVITFFTFTKKQREGTQNQLNEMDH